MASQDRDFVVALARGLQVLSCFRSANRALGNQELAERCALPKSTVSRLTSTLTRLGYLVQVPESGKYQLGIAALSLGSAMLARMDIRKTARPLMQELADFSGAVVALGVRDHLSMLYVECCRGGAALTLSLDVGSHIPLATSALGRAWLARVEQSERDNVLEQVRTLDDLAWPRVRAGVEEACREYAELGVACSFGEWQSSVHGIARAFSPGNGLPAMAINCGGPAGMLSREFLLDEVRPRLIAITQQLEGM